MDIEAASEASDKGVHHGCSPDLNRMLLQRTLFFCLLLTPAVTGCFQHAPRMSEKASGFFKAAREAQRTGDLKGALVLLNEADLAQPRNSRILEERGLLKAHSGDQAGGLADLDSAIVFCTDGRILPVYHGNKALVLFEAQRIKEACAEWEQAGRGGERYLQKYCK